MHRVFEKTREYKTINKIHLIFFGFLYLLWNYRYFYLDGAQPGLDNSWMVGLNWATSLGLRWDQTSMVFTYGPLYYLSGLALPEFHSPLTLNTIGLGLNIFYAASFTYIYSFFYERFHSGNLLWLTVPVMAILLLQNQTEVTALYLISFIFLPVLIQPESQTQNKRFDIRHARYLTISFILAVLPLIKFSYFFPGIVFLTTMILFFLHNKKYSDAWTLGICFIVLTLVVWMLATRQDIYSYFHYLYPRISMAGGYSEVMMLDFVRLEFSQLFILSDLLFIVLISGFVYISIIKKFPHAVAWFLPMSAFFVGFKNAFVRADGHAFLIFDHIFLLILYYVYLIEFAEIGAAENDRSWKPLLSRIITPVLLLVLVSSLGIILFGQRANNGVFPLAPKNSFLFSQFSQKVTNQNHGQEALKKHYNLDPEFLNHIESQKSIDIIPVEISLLYAYNLNWRPRPIPQTYAAYTSMLDNLDADFFRQSDSPDQILFALHSIDGRYPLFDMPNTFHAILDNYEFLTSDRDETFALFTKKKEVHSSTPVVISEIESAFGDRIVIPSGKGEKVFMAVNIEPTFLGKLADIIYKPTPILVRIKLDDGTMVSHRFVRDLGKNKLFLSTYVRTLSELQSVFENNHVQNIRYISFSGNAWLYKPKFTVQFYKLVDNH